MLFFLDALFYSFLSQQNPCFALPFLVEIEETTSYVGHSCRFIYIRGEEKKRRRDQFALFSIHVFFSPLFLKNRCNQIREKNRENGRSRVKGLFFLQLPVRRPEK